MSSQQVSKRAEITARNIGGIDETTVSLPRGVTVLEGENATNRTSLLEAIMAALGGDNVSIKGNADEGFVELDLDGETYTRRLYREGSTVRTDGDPYLTDATLADMFCFLVGSNEARRAVSNGENLREIIMRPVDTDEIQTQIDQLVDERRTIESELSDLDSLKDRLPALEDRRAELRESIEAAEEELTAKEEELDGFDADVEETKAEKEELEDRLEALRDKRASLEDLRYDLETERESLEASLAEKRELEGELEELPDSPVGEIQEVESRIDSLRQRKRTFEGEVTELQNVIGFNQEMLEDGDREVLAPESDSRDNVTDELLPDETVSCWTCGSEVQREQIESTLERLQELKESKLEAVRDTQEQLSELQEEVQTLRDEQRESEQLEQRHSQMERQIDESEATIERLTDRRDELEGEIENLEDEIEALEDDAYEEVLDLHREANQLEYDLGRLEGDLDDVETEIAEIESRLDEETELEARRESINDEIVDLRTRIDRIEQGAIEEFNDHMDVILEILGYTNLERIWLERVEKEVREGRRKVKKSVFELHIVRKTDGGATYEDTIDHLSESEREVTGLVFALAGFLVHEVYEQVPFMLLDSLEAIDADRIADLVEYVSEYSEYLVVALLAEDAAALKDEYDYVRDI